MGKTLNSQIASLAKLGLTDAEIEEHIKNGRIVKEFLLTEGEE